MTGYSAIERVRVPRHCALEVQKFLREAGQLRCEGFALWVGTREGEREFLVQQTVIPEQRPIRTDSGIMVVIGPDELHALNVWLHQERLSVIAQIHSHPTHAYHSDTDDHLAIATVVGSFSFVVPDFAKAAFSLPSWAPYRLGPDGMWHEMTPEDVARTIMLVD